MAKNIVVLAIKIVLAAALILWLIKQGRLDFTVFTALSFDAHTAILLLVGGISVFCGLLLLGWRLWLFLRFKYFLVSYIKVLGITVMGSFLGIVLPGLVSGDAMKAVYLCSNVSERRLDALASVIVDRVLGLYSLLLLGTLAFCLGWVGGALPFESPILLTGPLVVVFLGLGMVLIAWDDFFDSIAVQGLFSRMPETIQKFVQVLRGFLKAPRLVVSAIILSVLNHVLVIVGFIATARLLHDNLPVFTHFIINPLAMIMNMIPLTPGGLGMAESAFSIFFDTAGSPNGAMVGLLGRFIQYAVFILSGSVAVVLLKLRSHITTLE